MATTLLIRIDARSKPDAFDDSLVCHVDGTQMDVHFAVDIA